MNRTLRRNAGYTGFLSPVFNADLLGTD